MGRRILKVHYGTILIAAVNYIQGFVDLVYAAFTQTNDGEVFDGKTQKNE
jgi:hypothetical protein